MSKDARRARRLPTEDHKLLRHPRRYPRPRWQQRILRIVSPAYRARCRRAAETVRLVTMATRALEREQAGPQVAQLADAGNRDEKGTHIASAPKGFAETETPEVGTSEGDQR